MSKKIILITGASSGIGREFALQVDTLFQNMDEIWLVARRREQLEETASLLKTKTRIVPMDVTKDSAQMRLTELLELYDARICMLINCAGYGLMGPFEDAKQIAGVPKGQLGMIRVNCEALTQMTYRCIPFMGKNSRIIQLASSAAFLPQPYFAVYAATKAYVLSFSRALGEELLKKRIYVTSVCPGPVDTPFFDIAEKSGTTLAVKKITLVQSDKVVARALKDAYHKRPVSVYSMPIKAFYLLTKNIPHQWILSVMRLFQKGS